MGPLELARRVVRRARRRRLVKLLAASPGYRFTADYVTVNTERWAALLAPYRGRPDVRFLEIGSCEGRAAVWFLEHVLTGAGARLTCIDLFSLSRLGLHFDHNIRKTGRAGAVTKLAGRSDTILPTLPAGHCDLIYVDGGHQATVVLLDAVLAWRLLKPGGLMTFDDYAWEPALPPHLRPQMAIDLFLELRGPELELLHRDYQLTVEEDRRAGIEAVSKRPDTLIYAVGERPPLLVTLALGLQQVSLMAIYLVMIVVVVRRAGAPPAVAQSAVSLGLVAMGLSAGLQALPKGPVGSGYLAPPVLSAIYLPPSLLAVAAGGLPMVYGMTIVAGLFEAGLSRLLPKLRAVFPPLVCGFIVAAVGIELGLVGVKELLDVGDRTATGRFDVHVGVANLTLVVMIALAVWGRGMLRLLCSLVGLVTGFAAAGLFGLVSHTALARIADAPIVALPGLGHIRYDFDASLLVPFVLAGLAAGLRTIGVVTTCQRINDAEWKRPDLTSIQGGVLADGIGCAMGGALGTVGMGSAPSLVGVTQASGATSRVIAFAVTGLAAVLACSPKLAAVFLALPEAVVGAGLMFTASFMVAGGIQIIAARELDARKTFVVGVALLLGLSRAMFPDYYGALPRGLQALTGSLLSVAMIAAIALNLLFYLGLRRTASLVVEVSGKREAADAALADVMARSAKTWKIAPAVATRAVDAVERTTHLIRDGRLADGPVSVRVTFDETTLQVALEYRGDLLSLPAQRPVSEDNLVEEQPFVKGLSGFLVDVYPDRVRTSTDDGLCRVVLAFEA